MPISDGSGPVPARRNLARVADFCGPPARAGSELESAVRCVAVAATAPAAFSAPAPLRALRVPCCQ
mgnify:CR=1 FL=1